MQPPYKSLSFSFKEKKKVSSFHEEKIRLMPVHVETPQSSGDLKVKMVQGFQC